MNIYDFDKTIYDGDSSIDFYKFCVKKNKLLILNSFKVLFYYFLYIFKMKNIFALTWDYNICSLMSMLYLDKYQQINFSSLINYTIIYN